MNLIERKKYNYENQLSIADFFYNVAGGRIYTKSASCANGSIDSSAVKRAVEFEKSFAGRALAFTAIVRIYIHIFADGSGSNPALMLLQKKLGCLSVFEL